MKNFVVGLLVLLLCCAPPVWAQGQAASATESPAKNLVEEQQASKARAEVHKRGSGEQSQVKVSLRNKSEVKGYISHIDSDSFQVTDKKNGRVTTVAYADVDKVRGPGLSKGAKIGIGVGVGAAVAVGAFAAIAASWNGN
jgi:hypothetical protein